MDPTVALWVAVISAVASAIVTLAKPLYRLLRGRAVYLLDQQRVFREGDLNEHQIAFSEMQTEIIRMRERLDIKDARIVTQQDRLLVMAEQLGESRALNRSYLELQHSYSQIAKDAVQSALDMVNASRIKEGKCPLEQLAAVVSESSSPSTELQRGTADVQTLRAALTAIQLAMGQEPRSEPEHADETKGS